MEDRAIVAAIVAGDPDGLEAAYDQYAAPLYSYCCSMLREPADAADAVQDTFLIAAAKLGGLRDPGKLRPWLYAVARNESLRRLRAASATTALEEAGDVATESPSLGGQAERADLQELVRQAINGLNPGDRDVIELNLGRELEGDDLADALGVSRNHAHALLSRARNQLERSLGALIVARTGQAACTGLAAMLADWDGQLTVLSRKRISRHIEHCDICGERKRRELTPALFAGAIPLLAVVPGFRDQLLKLMADRTPAGLAHRLGVANRAAPFGPPGFPKPLRAPGYSPWHRALHHSHPLLPTSNAMMVGSATSVVAAGAIVAVIIGVPHSLAGPGGGTTHGAVTSASPAHSGSGARAGGGQVPSASNPGGASPSGAAGSGAGAAGSGAGARAGSGAGAGAGTGAGWATATPGAPSSVTSAGASAGSSPSTAPTAPASSASSSGAATVSPGTSTVSTRSLDLVAVNGTATGNFTITAHGGPVSYSIATGSALTGKLTVAPSSGSLASGQSVTITVTSASLLGLDGQLTISPGGQSVTVLLSVGV